MTEIILDQGSWSSKLSYTDRQRLRTIVKNTHLRFYPKDRITDYEADKLIDALGPKVGEDMIRAAVNRGLVA